VNTYAEVAWTAEDVRTLAPQLSEQEAEDFLVANGKHIAEAVVSAGWTAIETLLVYNGIEVKGGNNGDD